MSLPSSSDQTSRWESSRSGQKLEGMSQIGWGAKTMDGGKLHSKTASTLDGHSPGKSSTVIAKLLGRDG
jgi:hypothetical protein